MKKTITTTLLLGGLMSIFGVSTLLAAESESETIQEKAKAIVHDAKVKADKLVEDANARAQVMIEKAVEDANALKKESIQSAKETTEETKTLANKALEKAKTTSGEVSDKTKESTQTFTRGMEDKYIYTKDIVNKSYQKGKKKANDALIHSAIKYAFLMSPEIHSMKIDIDVKNGIVELFGKVKSPQETQKAIQIALSTEGVLEVKAFFAITE